MKKLWIQYAYTDTVNASVTQTADTREEAEEFDDLFYGCPWYSYDIAPPGKKGGDGKLINETGPFFFGECKAEYRAGTSGMWYEKPGAAGYIIAVRCARCNKTLQREEDEAGLKWLHRVAKWWGEHKED